LTQARGVTTVRTQNMSNIPRRFVLSLAAALLLSGCGDSGEPKKYALLRYDYLTKLKLNVGRVDIDDTWTPQGGGRHVEFLSPTTPQDALRQMADDRLIPVGNSGRAQFAILDASIVRQGDNYLASLAVGLDILNDAGERQRGIMAHSTDIHPVNGDDPDTVRADLYELTSKAMDDINVDFEYQIRHELAADLQTTSPTAPLPAPVDTQDLDAPGAAPPPPP
jgi:hypothetical protein